MLDDVPGLLNPIIQAMVHTADLKKQYAQQDIEKERNKQEAEARKEQLKQAQQVIDYTHEHNLAQLEAQHLRDQADIASHNATTLHTLNMAGIGGVQQDLLNAAIPQSIKDNIKKQQFSLPQGQPQGPQVDQFQSPDALPQTPAAQPTPAMFATPASEAQRFYQQTKAQNQGRAEGELPSQQALAQTHFGFQKQLQDAQEESAQKIAAMGRQSQEKIAGMSRSTQMAIANMENKTRLQVAGMGGDEGSQNLVHSLMMGGMTGEIKLNPANPLERLAYSNLQQIGAQTVDPKQILEAKNMQAITPLLDKLDKLAAQLPNTPAGAALEGARQGVVNTFTTSKLKNDINIINSQIMNVAKTTEGVTGRPLAAAMKPELDALAGVTTKSNMQDRINNLRDNFVNKLNNVIFSGMPDPQREIIDKKYGLKPIPKSAGASPETAVKAAQYEKTATGPNGHQIGKKNGKWYDIQTGQEVQ